jgi:hypothetical protein
MCWRRRPVDSRRAASLHGDRATCVACDHPAPDTRSSDGMIPGMCEPVFPAKTMVAHGFACRLDRDRLGGRWLR